MTLAEIPQAAGITGVLSAAGMDKGAVHDWFHRPRRELAWLTPALALTETGAPSAGRVLELARSDAAAAVAEAPAFRVTVIGAACEHRWRGTVHLDGRGGFALDHDDATCPECGGNAVVVLFGADLAGTPDA